MATTFAVVIVTLLVVHVALHSNGGTVFSLSRAELMHQAITAVALTVALMLTRGGRR
ncbi:hypothetical protein SPAN111604_11360 [Sphingomonas antarctica]|uniref:hypothetical protein n=1 Tax=Sphingomonas antarctica TaxID=2040274 RepID=UPI0039EBC63A